MNPTPIRKSIDGFSALTSSCFPVGPKNSSKREWIKGKDLYLANISGNRRVVAAVYIATDMHKTPFLMDCVTGTLYRPKDGKCYTSDHLEIIDFAKVEGMDKILMKVKSEQFTGGDE